MGLTCLVGEACRRLEGLTATIRSVTTQYLWLVQVKQVRTLIVWSHPAAPYTSRIRLVTYFEVNYLSRSDLGTSCCVRRGCGDTHGIGVRGKRNGCDERKSRTGTWCFPHDRAENQ